MLVSILGARRSGLGVRGLGLGGFRCAARARVPESRVPSAEPRVPRAGSSGTGLVSAASPSLSWNPWKMVRVFFVEPESRQRGERAASPQATSCAASVAPTHHRSEPWAGRSARSIAAKTTV